MRKNNVISIAIPGYILDFLKSKARKLSAEQDKDINHADLIRKALVKFYKIKEPKDEDRPKIKGTKQGSKSKNLSK